MHSCFLSFFQQILRQNVSWFFSKKREMFPRIGFISKPTVQKTTRDFHNGPLCKRLAYPYVKITKDFEHFQFFNFETRFLKNETLSKKTGGLSSS